MKIESSACDEIKRPTGHSDDTLTIVRAHAREDNIQAPEIAIKNRSSAE